MIYWISNPDFPVWHKLISSNDAGRTLEFNMNDLLLFQKWIKCLQNLVFHWLVWGKVGNTHSFWLHSLSRIYMDFLFSMRSSCRQRMLNLKNRYPFYGLRKTRNVTNQMKTECWLEHFTRAKITEISAKRVGICQVTEWDIYHLSHYQLKQSSHQG